jgi:hypothetical protein
MHRGRGRAEAGLGPDVNSQKKTNSKSPAATPTVSVEPSMTLRPMTEGAKATVSTRA